MSRPIARLLAVPFTALLVLSVACAPSGTATPPAGSAAASAAPVATPRVGGTVIYGRSGAAPSPFDMVRSPNNNDAAVAQQMYETLYIAGEKGPEPWLAERTAISTDGLTWTLTLRSGVKFHDGTDFDAAAVKYNFDIRKSTAAFRGNPDIATLKEVKVVDPKTVQLVMTQPKATLQAILTHPLYGMQSPTAMQKFTSPTEYSNNAAGTGPFKRESGAPGANEHTFVRFDGYWGGKPYLDKIVVRNIIEQSSRLAALEAGDVQFISQVPAEELARLNRDAKFATFFTLDYSPISLTMHNSMAPTTDKRVRQAIAYAVNAPSYLSLYPQGVADAIPDAMLPPNHVGTTKLPPYTRDQTKARALLAEAGIRPGTPLQLISIQGITTQFAQLVKQDLDAVGFAVTIRSLDQTAFTAESSKKPTTWNLRISTHVNAFPDAEVTLLRFFLSTAAQNFAEYKNERVDTLLRQQATQVDPAVRNRTLAEIQQLIWADMPWYPLALQKTINASVKTLRDVQTPNLAMTTFGHKAWLAAP